MLKNTTQRYGWISISLHWTMAIAFIAMYFLGDWMVELDYYDEWYHKAPDIHKSAGVLLVLLMVARFAWNHLHTRPAELGQQALMNRVARLGHLAFYLIVVLLFISGYLISTAKGKPIDVFGWFEVPALLPAHSGRGDLAGEIHEWIALGFMLLAIGHAAAALYHHFLLKDATLKRMLGRS